MKKLGLTFSIFLCTFQFAYADMDIAWDLLVKSKGRVDNYPVIVRHMVNQGLYFASVPYIKEFLVRTKGVNSKSVDEVIDKVVTQVGIKQFEVLPTSILSRSNAPMLRYILAKKYFRTGKYSQAFVALKNAIPKNHPSKPFALQLEASLYSITKNMEMPRPRIRNAYANLKISWIEPKMKIVNVNWKSIAIIALSVLPEPNSRQGNSTRQI